MGNAVAQDGRLILAPMQGLTELLLRRVFYHCFPNAFDYAVSPFLSLTHGNLSDAWKKIGDVLPERNKDSIPVVPQILGREADEFVALANRLGEVGYNEVNWNIGCPMRRVAGKHRGSGILPYPDEVREVLDKVVPRLQVALSVKMRLGHYRDDEILSLIPILNDYPLCSVILHPRTGKQQYGGNVNLDRFGEVAQQIRHPLIYNGDIRSAEDYRRIRQRFPQVKDVMIGRGALQNPLLPYIIKGLPTTREMALHFVGAMVDAIEHEPLSEQAKVRKTKEYWCLLWHSLPISEQQHTDILHLQGLRDIQKTIKDFLSSAGSESADIEAQ
ncbi:MAG: tRNA-dihydrouridine synthase family protein [Bacteroidales bacterium]|nr:tRNA-dihydrouridine synthase family protein [Bacteroidales bacterium]